METGDYVMTGTRNRKTKKITDGIIGKVLGRQTTIKSDGTKAEMLYVLTPAGYEYEVNISSKKIHTEVISERKYFHELMRYPGGIF